MEILELATDLILICLDIKRPWFWIVAAVSVLVLIIAVCF